MSAPDAAGPDRGRRSRRRWLSLSLGFVAVALGLYAQWLIARRGAIHQGIYWYCAAVATLIFGWSSSERNRGFVDLVATSPGRSGGRARRSRGRHRIVVVVLAAITVAVNVLSVLQLRAAGYHSWIGGIGWLGSLVLLVAWAVLVAPAFSRSERGLRARLGWTDRNAVEIVLFVAILLAHWGLRLYRLGDLTTGVHGDEGEAGMDALAILNGQRVSPFTNGWYGQSNVYYWSIALGMALFGTDLGGLRAFAVAMGGLLLLPFYFLVRMWFGVRTALIASLLLAVSDVGIHFSRQQFSNIMTPLTLVAGAYFFFRGLRTHRPIDFVAAGFSHALGLYFYGGGKLAPLLWGAFVLHVFVLLRVLRLPRAYRRLRSLAGASRSVAFARALRFESRPLRAYSTGLAAYTLALACLASPWLAFYFDHPEEGNARARQMLIFNNEQRMAEHRRVTHGPLYLGVQSPFTDEGLRLPVTTAKTGASVRVLEEGFWPRVLVGQLGATLSMFTHSLEGSSIYTFTRAPVAKPIEATLIILGMGWALWRWRDVRMACLSIWFWSTIIVGGVLTIDAPYMARLVGIIPVMAVFAALILEKLWADVEAVSRGWRSPAVARAVRAAMAAAVVGLLAFLGWQNFHDYYFRYVGPHAFTEGTGQAVLVRDMSRRALDDGLPPPRFYHLGVHYIFWGYGVNRFLNYGAIGSDTANVAEALPIVDDLPGGAVFLTWPVNWHYLPMLEEYYPRGVKEPFHYGRPDTREPLLLSYRVSPDELAARRHLLATYRPARGEPLERRESGLGTFGPPPSGLTYPVDARWSGGIFAPGYGRYRFRLDGGGARAALAIDGVPILATEGEAADRTVALARGLHHVDLSGSLHAATSRVFVLWATGDGAFLPIPNTLLWSAPGGALLGELRSASGGIEQVNLDAAGPRGAVVERRLDGFLGFRNLGSIYRERGLVKAAATWSGTLKPTAAGPYVFTLNTSGACRVLIDGLKVIETAAQPQPRATSSNADLEAARHAVTVDCDDVGASGYLELYWGPPGQANRLLGPSDLEPAVGVWTDDAILAPDLPAQEAHGESKPGVTGTVLVRGKGLSYPYAIAVGAGGELVVADARNHRLVVFNESGRKLDSFGEEGSGLGEFDSIEDIAIGPDGRIYVLELRPSRVQRLRSDGTPEAVVAEGQWCAPNGLDVDEGGRLYIAETCASRILQLSATGVVERTFSGGSDPATRLEQPLDVVVGEGGALYVVDLRARVARIDMESDRIVASWPVGVGGAVAASSLAVDGALLYVTDPDRHVIHRVDTTTGAVVSLGRPGQAPGEFTTPLGIAVGREGEVYVGDGQTGRLQVLNGG